MPNPGLRSKSPVDWRVIRLRRLSTTFLIRSIRSVIAWFSLSALFREGYFKSWIVCHWRSHDHETWPMVVLGTIQATNEDRSRFFFVLSIFITIQIVQPFRTLSHAWILLLMEASVWTVVIFFSWRFSLFGFQLWSKIRHRSRLKLADRPKSKGVLRSDFLGTGLLRLSFRTKQVSCSSPNHQMSRFVPGLMYNYGDRFL